MGIAASGHHRAPYFSVDVHLHTNRGSADSNLSPRDLVERARVIGIGAVRITEHDTMWPLAEVGEAARDAGVVGLRGMEVTTDMGHIGVFGLDTYPGGTYKLSALRRFAAKSAATLIA